MHTVIKTILSDGTVETVHKFVAHNFTVSDVDDPDIYAAEPLYNWEQSECGKWVMKNATEVPQWQRVIDHNTFGYKYAIIATLREKDYVYWLLKFK